MAEKFTVASVDFDGVLFPRIPAQLDAFRPWTWKNPLELPLSRSMAQTNPPIRTEPLTKKEQHELESHAKRYVKPEVAEFVHNLPAGLKVGNTGRSNNLEMVSMTRERLEDGGILNDFSHIRFKPKGMSSDESKYWGMDNLKLLGYEDAVHYDDNALLQKRLAKLFPEMRFVVVQDLSSGVLFSKDDMAKYPNVARIGIRKSGKIDVAHVSQGFGALPFKV